MLNAIIAGRLKSNTRESIVMYFRKKRAVSPNRFGSGLAK